MAELTHWRKLTNPDYLGSYAFQPGEEKQVTIDYVRIETITGMEGRNETLPVMHFKQNDIKPLILNRTNAKMVERLFDNPYIENWKDRDIILCVQKVKAFGEMVDAVRVKKAKPTPIICESCGKPITAYGNNTPAAIAERTRRKFGKTLCAACGKEYKA